MLSYEEVARFRNCSSVTTSVINMMRGLVLLSTFWLLLVLAHHGEGRLVRNTFNDVAASKPVPCNWVCGPENMYHCECIPVLAQQDLLLHTEETTDPTAAAAGRVFGIPGTIIGRSLLQAGPGLNPGVITTLDRQTSVQVMCKKSDALVQDDPWLLKVHVVDWAGGLVPDFWVQCRHAGNCNVPFCV